MREDLELWQSPKIMKQKCEKFFRDNPTGTRRKVGVAKDISEEAYPLALALEKIQDVEGALECRLAPINFRNDAEVRFLNKNIRFEIQIVSGMPDKFHYEDSLRMEYLEKYGSVTMTGPVTTTGSRKDPNREISIEPMAISRKEYAQELSHSIASAIQRKALKVQFKNTWLLVWIDDWLAIKYLSKDDLASFYETIEGAANKAITAFSRVFLIGTSGSTHAELTPSKRMK